jgi:hypothetical protein
MCGAVILKNSSYISTTEEKGTDLFVWFQQALSFDKSNWKGLASQIQFDEAKAVVTKNSYKEKRGVIYLFGSCGG